MARVPAFHSSNPSDPDVHHVCSNCHAAQHIPAANRQPGTGGNRLCLICDGEGQEWLLLNHSFTKQAQERAGQVARP